MPSTKDLKTGKWEASFRYKDYQGKIQRKHKRGFKTKKEALKYEREFLAKSEFNLSMSFQSLYELYMEDMKNRLRENTYISKEYMINLKILPFFKDMKLEKITPVIVRKWQNQILNLKNPKTNASYSQTYIKTINNQIVAIFNYAVKFHSLKENPCHKAGTIGKKHADEMNIWTVSEFNKFVILIKHKPISYTGFQILFWCGLRIGELLALTVKDVDFKNKTLNVNKSYQRFKKKDVITEPKTPKSKRIISIPDDLIQIIKEYIEKIYMYDNDTRLFPTTKSTYEHDMIVYSKKASLKKIRIHDLRHSHASFLFHHKVDPLTISKRLGHEKIETTLNIYAHLYKSTNEKLIEILNLKKGTE